MPRKEGVRLTVPEKILDLFKDKLGDKGIFNEYFYGDPVSFPAESLPALVVSEDTTNYKQGATGMDEVEHIISIQIVMDKKADFGKPGNEVGLERELNEAAQGRDETTGEFLDTTIMGILRKNFTLDKMVVNQIGSINFGVVARPDDSLTAEAQLTVRFTEFVVVNNRQ